MSYALKLEPALRPKLEKRGTPPQFAMSEEMVYFIHHRKRPEKPA